MFSSILLLFELVSICQYALSDLFLLTDVTSSNKIWQNDDTNSMMVEPEQQISNVILKNKTSGLWFCGGNLINTAYILTAAECAVDRRPEDIIVYAGYKRLDQPDMIAHPIREIIIHEEYDLHNPLRNSIALLRLMNSIDATLYVNRYIRIVPVPNSSGRRNLAQVQAELQQKSYILPATISGYGIIAKNQSYSSVEILKSNAFISNWMLCKELLKDSYNISESHMCIEDPSSQRRISDVGGPLIFDSSVVGIALYKEWEEPTGILLFTNVLSYWKWIQQQIESRNNTVPCKKHVPFNNTRQTVYFEKKKVSLGHGELLHHVILKNETSRFVFCGGSIINLLFVLTSAECVVGRQNENIIVLANFTDMAESSVFVRTVTKVIIHDDYNPSDPWRNDIALLKLNKCYQHKNILKGVLPNRRYRRFVETLLLRPLSVSVSGFGIIAEKQPESTTTRYMMKYTTYMYEWTYCKKLFEGIPYNISESQICAYDPYNFADVNDLRTSDVGSPLVFGQNTIVGVALSANWNTCSNNTKCPLLFTNTTSYITWIRTQIGIHSGENRC